MTIEQRLRRLERQNRWMKRTGVLALAIVATVVLSGQAKRGLPHLKARSLTVVDARGTSRVVVSDEGLRVNDRHGNSRVALRTISDDEPGMTFWDKSGKPRFLIRALGNGSTKLDLLNKHGKTRVALSVNKNGEPRLDLRGQNGNTQVRIEALADGRSELILFNTKGNPWATLVVE